MYATPFRPCWKVTRMQAVAAWGDLPEPGRTAYRPRICLQFVMTDREAARTLRRLGCEDLPRRSGGSHRTWRTRYTGSWATLPDWGDRTLKLGTLREAVCALGLD